MTHEELFLRTIEDLEQRTYNDSTGYELLRGSGLLRQLLLDGNRSLLHLVNRSVRQRVSFQTHPFSQIPGGLRPPRFQYHNISPRHAPQNCIPLNLDGLLATVCMAGEASEFTVRHVIKYCANVAGGIHAGDPEDAIQHHLADLSQENQTLGMQTSVYALKGIGETVLTGLHPLVIAIKEKQSAGGGI